MVKHVASILDQLELPYRILRLCGGDLSFTSSLTYDFDVFSAGQKRWLEVSSVSNFESFQANRLKLRFKNNEGKSQLCHTLNGSALALPRIFAALIDGLDGRIARLIKATSKVGKELDSLTDMISFGVARILVLRLSFALYCPILISMNLLSTSASITTTFL